MKATITINGHEYPQPDLGFNLIVSTLVNSGRNGNAVVVAQKIGRDQQKINDLTWTLLDAETWSNILKEFDKNFFAVVEYPDMVTNSWKTIKMYPGDRSAQPFSRDPTTGLPDRYRDCKVNIIDVGE